MLVSNPYRYLEITTKSFNKLSATPTYEAYEHEHFLVFEYIFATGEMAELFYSECDCNMKIWLGEEDRDMVKFNIRKSEIRKTINGSSNSRPKVFVKIKLDDKQRKVVYDYYVGGNCENNH